MKKISIISILIVLIDQIIKNIVKKFLLLGESINIIKDFFKIEYVQNIGAAFSILEGKKIFLIIMAIVALTLMFKFLLQKKDYSKIEIITYSFLISGIFSNMIDRIIFGYVIDYLSFNIFKYAFPVFNLADICIVIGCFLLVIMTFKEDYHGNKNN